MRAIWKMQLNLDELNRSNLQGMTEKLRSDLWTGLVFGCNGLDLPEDSSKTLRAMFEVSSAWRQEAEGFQSLKSAGGQKSADTRKARFGTSQPQKLEESSEDSSEDSSEQTPNLSSNLQSTIKEKKKRLSVGEKMGLLQGYPEAALSVVRSLLPNWPTTAGDRQITNDPHATAARITDILAKNPSVPPELLIRAAGRYLESMRASNSEKYISALQFFFGPGKKGSGVMPKWEEQVRAIQHEASLENK